MLAIYKRELRSFFHGMMGYLLTAFLLAASGIYFLALNLGYGLTDFGYYTLYRTIFMLLLYFPVLAMRSLAEERRARTDQLLLTSPVSVWGIVVGKYLAMLVVLLVPTAIMGLYPLILSQFGTVPLQTAYGALAGFFLLGACLLSIGLFVSSVTENQVAAAVITLVVMLVLYFMSGLASYVSTAASASLTALSRSAVTIIALVGIHPTFRQVPPKYFSSTMQVLFPIWAALMAVSYPPGPAPMTVTS